LAASPALAAAQSARLLQLQRRREARLRAEAAQAAASREAARAAQDAAARHAARVAEAGRDSARLLWDGARGTALAAGPLATLREAERQGLRGGAHAQALADDAGRDRALAEERHVAARSAFAACARLATQRGRLDDACCDRLRRHLHARAEAAAEDDLPAPAQDAPVRRRGG
jgi:hypothetical protein